MVVGKARLIPRDDSTVMGYTSRSLLPRAGGTIVEVMVSVMIVGVLIVPVMSVLMRTANGYYRDTVRHRAVHLAHDLMAEIQTLPYQDPQSAGRRFGRELDEDPNDRTTWDDIDDYRGLDESPPRTRVGTVIEDAQDYRRRVEFRQVSVVADRVQAVAGDTIREGQGGVTPPVGPEVRLTALRFLNGLGDRSVPVQSQSIQSIDIEAKLEDLIQIRGQTELWNQFPGTGER